MHSSNRINNRNGNVFDCDRQQLCLRLSRRKYVIIRIDRVLFIFIMTSRVDDVRSYVLFEWYKRST